MPRSNSALVLTLAVLAAVNTSRAQEVSIGEYSAVQRQAIADEMAKLRGKVAAAAAPAAAASAPPVAAIVMRRTAPPPPSIRLAGVSIMQRRSSAEISVDGTAYMLEVGDAVPGTAQTVTYVGEDKVQLTTPASSRKGKPVVVTYKVRVAR